MDNSVIDIQLRWSDLDPNFHLRHSVYYDWAALSRIEILSRFGLTAHSMKQLNIGPILFREECVFKKEIRSGDEITIDLKLLKARRDYSRWSIQHTVRKKADIISAVITVDGAWMNTSERKLAIPPALVEKAFSEMPRDENFQWTN